MASRVENAIILQDTGSGGSWSVSSDRLIWAKAAYDYALFKQSSEYFEWVYDVVERTLNQDFYVIFDSVKNLYRGETSFIDWREQSYPRWIDSVFIASSYALGTNNVYLAAINSCVLLSKILEKPENVQSERKVQEYKLKSSINKYFWQENCGYFSNYIVSNVYDFRYDGYETLEKCTFCFE